MQFSWLIMIPMTGLFALRNPENAGLINLLLIEFEFTKLYPPRCRSPPNFPKKFKYKVSFVNKI